MEKHYLRRSRALCILNWNKLKKTTYWNLVATGKVFAWTVFYVDNFKKTKFLWPIFEYFFVALEQDAMDISLDLYKKSKHTRTW